MTLINSTNIFSRGLFLRHVKSLSTSSDVTLLLPEYEEAIVLIISLRAVVGDKKNSICSMHVHTSKYRCFRRFSSTRWVLEYPVGRGYEYAEISYTILTRAPRFSTLGSRSTMKLYMRPRCSWEEGRFPIQRRFKRAAPENC